jgi:very-short-patch-repair endonuclease
MNAIARQVCVLAAEQHDVVASWQLRRFSRNEVREGLRGLRRVHHGVCALGDLSELGWYMAAALAMGPTGAVSHVSALMLMELRPQKPGDIHVSYVGGGRGERAGLRLHRRRNPEVGLYQNIPVTSPTQSLRDADLKPHELYRALEEADRRNLRIDLLNDVVELQQAVIGRTRSDTEAAFILLCREHGLPLPLVNQHLNGYETDFHWPERRLVVEVDGFEHHRERAQFNNDRYRGLVHRTHGWEVVRVSADHVYDEPELVLRALDVGRALVA